eukprot:1265314-Alexandrium_andersonii.AAC.1
MLLSDLHALDADRFAGLAAPDTPLTEDAPLQPQATAASKPPGPTAEQPPGRRSCRHLGRRLACCHGGRP